MIYNIFSDEHLIYKNNDKFNNFNKSFLLLNFILNFNFNIAVRLFQKFIYYLLSHETKKSMKSN